MKNDTISGAVEHVGVPSGKSSGVSVAVNNFIFCIEKKFFAISTLVRVGNNQTIADNLCTTTAFAVAAAAID